MTVTRWPLILTERMIYPSFPSDESCVSNFNRAISGELLGVPARTAPPGSTSQLKERFVPRSPLIPSFNSSLTVAIVAESPWTTRYLIWERYVAADDDSSLL